jgi:DNA replication protein DnaC
MVWETVHVLHCVRKATSTKISTVCSVQGWSKTVYLNSSQLIPENINIKLKIKDKKTGRYGNHFLTSDMVKFVINRRFIKYRVSTKFNKFDCVRFLNVMDIQCKNATKRKIVYFLNSSFNLSVKLNEIRLFLLDDLPRFFFDDVLKELQMELMLIMDKNSAINLSKMLNVKNIPLLFDVKKCIETWLKEPYNPNLILPYEVRKSLPNQDEDKEEQYKFHMKLIDHENKTGHTFMNKEEEVNNCIFVDFKYELLPNTLHFGTSINSTICETNNKLQHVTIRNAERSLSYFWNSNVYTSQDDIKDEKANEEQLIAIKNSFSFLYSCIVGGPGTGKSWLIEKIACRWFEQKKGRKVLILSSYHQPLKNLQQRFNYDFIEYSTITSFSGTQTTSEYLIIVEEVGVCTMIDLHKVFKLSHTQRITKITMFGDHNQLKPIGAGQPLYDFMKLYPSSVTTLTKNMRSNSKVLIENLDNVLSVNTDLVVDEDQFDWVNNVTEISLENKLDFFNSFMSNFDFQKDVVIVQSNSVRRIFNTLLHNRSFKCTFNDAKWNDKRRFIVKTRLICLKTHPDQLYTNGTRATVIKNFGHKLIIEADDGKKYNIKNMERYWDLAYSITAHKAQGSEYDHVYIYTFNDYPVSRDWLYTSISRAKKKVTYLVPPRQHDHGVFNPPRINESLLCKNNKRKR